MFNLKFRIGTKLGLSAGLGVLLVAGMVANEHFTNTSLAATTFLVSVNHMNKADAETGAAAVQRNYLIVGDIGFAHSIEQVDKAFDLLRASNAVAIARIDAALQRATRASTKDVYKRDQSAD